MVYWWYILKVSVCIIVFYTFYILILRRNTFFLLNRFCLILGLILSFLIPVLNFSIFKSQPDIILPGTIYPFLSEPEHVFFQSQDLSDRVAIINYPMVLPIIYFAGMLILFFKFLISVMRIIRIRNHSEICRIGGKRMFKVNLNLPFSFFNMIFLPKGENNRMIIEHEMAHVKQYHWLDLVLIEVASMLLWFNPFIFFYRKSLKLQHEYLADSSVIKDENQ